jgi:peptidoglycan hydrolase-like protein with peptidoglycan-binding domain
MAATIRKGSKGADVTKWQAAIGAKPIDGIFGAGTETATKTWQRNHGLVADGIVGAKSWATVEGARAPTAAAAPRPATPAAAPRPATPVAAPRPATPVAAPRPATPAAVRPATPVYSTPAPASPVRPTAPTYITPTQTNVRPTAVSPVTRIVQNAPVTGSVTVPTASGSVTLSANPPAPAAKPSWFSVPKNRQMALFGGLGAVTAMTALYFLAFRHKDSGQRSNQGYPQFQTRQPDYLSYQSLAQRPNLESGNR